MFVRELGDDVEESLATVEGLVSFGLSESVSSLSPRVSSPAGNLGQAVGGVVDCEDFEPCVCEQPFVLAGRNEEVVADRSSDRQLVAVKRPGDADRIGEDEPPFEPQQASPISEDATSIREMIDRVDAENRIERPVLERKRLARICPGEADPALETGLARKPPSIRDGIVEELDTNGLASGQPGEVKGGPAGPASHIQQSRRRSESQLPPEPFELVPRQPAVLADVVTERSAANLLVYVCGEVAVVSFVVTANRRLLGHMFSMTRRSGPPGLRGVSQTFELAPLGETP